MLAHVLLPDALAEEVLIEDVDVGEEVLNVLRLHVIRLFGSELLEEALLGLRLRLGVGLQARVDPVQSFQLLIGHCRLDALLREVKKLPEIVEECLEVLSKSQHRRRHVERLLLLLRLLGWFACFSELA